MEIQQVIFNLEELEYGVDILNINEIVKMDKITKIPNSPPYLDGIINLRGKVIPVIDLRAKFNLPEIMRDEETRIMVVSFRERIMGMVVDKVSEVKRIDEEQIETQVEMTLAISDDFVKGIAKLEEGRLVTLLDVGKLFD